MRIVCIADVHIKSKQNPSFEKQRILKLAEALIVEPLVSSSLYILGDTFDSNHPTLIDIKIFYDFISIVSSRFKDIRIINGNHDSQCFLYLPEVNFKYYHNIMYDEQMTFVGWSNLQYIPTLEKTKILFTHARCTIPPYIEEEISFVDLSSKADIVILGDIHHPVKVQDNIYYTFEPTRNTYTKYQENSTGYLVLDTMTLEVTRRFPILPYKAKLEFDSMESFIKDRALYDKQPNMYKVVITDYIEKLRTMGVANVIFEYNPRVIIEETPLKEEEELKEIINQRISISDALLTHTQESYKFSIETLNQIKKRLRG